MFPVVGTTTPLPLPTTIPVPTTSDVVVETTTPISGTTFSAATDPCSMYPSLCPLGQQCISTVDSFYCVPNTQPTTGEITVETTTPLTGTTFSPATDPCSILSLCPPDQQCISTVDSFYCVPNTQPTTSEIIVETTTPLTGTTFSLATGPCSILSLCPSDQQCVSTVDSFYCVPYCQTTWFFYNGSCYLLVKSRKTNQEASVSIQPKI